jgi:hypothetical protein
MKKLFALTLTATWLFTIAAPPIASATVTKMLSAADSEASPTEAVLTLDLKELRSVDGTINHEAVKSTATELCSEMMDCDLADVIWAVLQILEECGESGGWVVIECTENGVEMQGDGPTCNE